MPDQIKNKPVARENDVGADLVKHFDDYSFHVVHPPSGKNRVCLQIEYTLFCRRHLVFNHRSNWSCQFLIWDAA